MLLCLSDGYGRDFLLFFSFVGTREENPIPDPCLPLDMRDTVTYHDQMFYLRGLGDYTRCQINLQSVLNNTHPCMKKPCSMNGVYQPEIDFE